MYARRDSQRQRKTTSNVKIAVLHSSWGGHGRTNRGDSLLDEGRALRKDAMGCEELGEDGGRGWLFWVGGISVKA